MVSLLSFPGRLGGLSIADKDFNSIRLCAEKGEARSSFEKLWDKIKDWFFASNVSEAKECLYQLYSDQTPDRTKLLKFLQLKSLVSPAYQNRFIERAETDGFSIVLNAAPDAAIFYCKFSNAAEICNLDYVQAEIDKKIAVLHTSPSARKDNLDILAKDILRAEYQIDGEILNADRSVDCMIHSLENKLVDRLNCTPAQVNSIISLVQQGSLQLVLRSARQEYGGLLKAGNEFRIGNINIDQARKDDQRYSIVNGAYGIEISGYDKGEFRDLSSLPSHISKDPRLNLLADPVTSFRFEIGRDGHVIVMSATFGKEPDYRMAFAARNIV